MLDFLFGILLRIAKSEILGNVFNFLNVLDSWDISGENGVVSCFGMLHWVSMKYVTNCKIIYTPKSSVRTESEKETLKMQDKLVFDTASKINGRVIRKGNFQ